MGFKSSFIAISSTTKIYLSELLLETGLKCHAEKKKHQFLTMGRRTMLVRVAYFILKYE